MHMPLVVVALGFQIASLVPSPHLRPEAAVRPLVARAAAQSPLVQALIDRIEAADVIVYVRIRQFAQSDLNGRVALLSAMPARQRFLMIELACGRSDVMTMSTLGHELYHAVEIAEQPSIVDGPALAAYYSHEGEKTGDVAGHLTFETRGAEAAGVRVRRELLATPARHAWTLK
jgi:hypothetical protein